VILEVSLDDVRVSLATEDAAPSHCCY